MNNRESGKPRTSDPFYSIFEPLFNQYFPNENYYKFWQLKRLDGNKDLVAKDKIGELMKMLSGRNIDGMEQTVDDVYKILKSYASFKFWETIIKIFNEDGYLNLVDGTNYRGQLGTMLGEWDLYKKHFRLVENRNGKLRKTFEDRKKEIEDQLSGDVKESSLKMIKDAEGRLAKYEEDYLRDPKRKRIQSWLVYNLFTPRNIIELVNELYDFAFKDGKVRANWFEEKEISGKLRWQVLVDGVVERQNFGAGV